MIASTEDRAKNPHWQPTAFPLELCGAGQGNVIVVIDQVFVCFVRCAGSQTLMEIPAKFAVQDSGMPKWGN